MTARAMGWRVVAVQTDGTVIKELPQATIQDITTRLSDMGEAGFTMPTDDPATSLLKQVTTEIQMWAPGAGQPLIWGPITGWRGGPKSITFKINDPWWLLHRRYVGRPRVNYLTNPSFESGGGPWGLGTDWIQDHPTNRIDTLSRFNAGPGRGSHGDYVAAMIHNGAQPALITQRKVLTGGIAWNASAWLWVHDYSGDDAPLFMLETRNPNVNDAAGNPAPIRQVVAKIDGNVEKNTWIRQSLAIAAWNLPAGVTNPWVGVRLYAPTGGHVWWDSVQLVRNEAVQGLVTDRGEAVRNLIAHAQDAGQGRSDLNLAVVSADVGVNTLEPYRYWEHANIAEALKAMHREGWFDFDLSYTGSTRTITAYYGGKAVVRPGTVLTVGRNCQLAEAMSSADDLANDVTVVRPFTDDNGTGSTREEARVSDPAALGGVTLERVETAGDDALPRSLERMANRLVTTWVDPPDLPQITVTDPSLLGNIQLGDVVQVLADYGYIAWRDYYRVVEIRFHPERQQQTLTLNRDEWSGA